MRASPLGKYTSAMIVGEIFNCWRYADEMKSDFHHVVAALEKCTIYQRDVVMARIDDDICGDLLAFDILLHTRSILWT